MTDQNFDMFAPDVSPILSNYLGQLGKTSTLFSRLQCKFSAKPELHITEVLMKGHPSCRSRTLSLGY